jgi:hypothetical protein
MLDSLKLNLLSLRIRSFDFGGNTFRVLMPLTAELDALMKKINSPEQAIKDLIAAQEAGKDSETLDKASKTAAYIVEAWGLLCNEAGERVQTNYEELQECIPFAIQVEVAKRVIDLLQPNWSDERKN